MSHHFRCDNTTALVQTDKGTVKGYVYDGLLIFKGVPYWFHNIDLVEYPHGPQADPNLPQKIQEAAFAGLMAFARTGNPEGGLIPAWPACREGAENTLVIGPDTRVRVNFDHELIAAQTKYMGPAFGRMMARLRASAQH